MNLPKRDTLKHAIISSAYGSSQTNTDAGDY